MNIPGWVKDIWGHIGKATPVTLMILGVAVSIAVMGILIELYEVIAGDAKQDFGQNLLGYIELSAIIIFAVGPCILLVFVAFSWLTEFLTGWLAGKQLPEPEELQTIVKFDDQFVQSTNPDGEILQLAWRDMGKLLIRTTDEGPEVCDVYWIFMPSDATRDPLVIPLDAQGAEELLPALQERLPGFDNEEVLVAMGTTTPEVFEIWSADRPYDRAGEIASAV